MGQSKESLIAKKLKSVKIESSKISPNRVLGFLIEALGIGLKLKFSVGRAYQSIPRAVFPDIAETLRVFGLGQ
jgi:hypothetical protein